jgi:hypothetical protein
MKAQTDEPLCTVSKCAYVNYDAELKNPYFKNIMAV